MTIDDALKVIYNTTDIMGGSDKFWDAYRTIEKELKISKILKKKIKLKSYEIGIEDIIIYEEDEGDYKIIKEWLKGE